MMSFPFYLKLPVVAFTAHGLTVPMAYFATISMQSPVCYPTRAQPPGRICGKSLNANEISSYFEFQQRRLRLISIDL